MNIGSLLSRNARYRPQHTAIVFEQHRLSFMDFNRRVNRLANALVSMGVREGDKVVTLLPNCLELLEVYWAAAKIGVVAVPLTPRSSLHPYRERLCQRLSFLRCSYRFHDGQRTAQKQDRRR
jgi:acyl-CoA synthetase (AMP-forming)/AMP-acid ligase II